MGNREWGKETFVGWAVFLAEVALSRERSNCPPTPTRFDSNPLLTREQGTIDRLPCLLLTASPNPPVSPVSPEAHLNRYLNSQLTSKSVAYTKVKSVILKIFLSICSINFNQGNPVIQADAETRFRFPQ